jgi:hypothetical protein
MGGTLAADRIPRQFGMGGMVSAPARRDCRFAQRDHLISEETKDWVAWSQ